MPDLTLYYANGACSSAVHATLLELSIPFKPVEIGFNSQGFYVVDGSLTREEYLQKIHPMGYVPALVVDGEPVTEIVAILSYVASLKPEKNLLGETPLEKARVLEWLVWLSSTLHGSSYGALWRPGRFIEDEGAFQAVKENARKKLKYCYGRIEENIGGKHAVGDHLTVVDFFLHVFWRWGGQGKVGTLDASGLDMSQYPRFRELVRNVEKYEGLREAMRVEKKELAFPDERL